MDRLENCMYGAKCSCTDIQKFSDTLRPMEGKILKRIALITMKLTYFIHLYKSMFPIRNTIGSINILYTGSQKIFRYILAYGEEEFLNGIETYLCCTKYYEMYYEAYFNQMYKSMFRIQDDTKYF